MSAPDRSLVTIQLGRHKLTGIPALLVLLAILLVIALLVIRAHPSLSNWPMWVSGAGWLLFIIYWSSAARNSAPARNKESDESRRVHQLLMNGALLLLFVPVPGLRQRLLPASPLLIPAGLAIQAGFWFLAVWARKSLGRNWSGQIDLKVDHQLIRNGPYRLVRHPIYSAMLGMFAGTTLVSGTVHALLAMALIAFAYWRKIRLEETWLRRAFGSAYVAYQSDTWALFPPLL
ncbi:MAG TPA: isoprenylcysteine carboxylmethyltransferase family protein [Bryobacteraceae bacterium]|nr:isoprenylcysteine carboxylmethyltransferase family protein [Bryobacteraceae bacterium]